MKIDMKLVNALTRWIFAMTFIIGIGFLLYKFVMAGIQENDLIKILVGSFFTGVATMGIEQMIFFYFRTSSPAEKEKTEQDCK